MHYPAHWQGMRFSYDNTLTVAWEKSITSKVPVLNFLRTYRGPLSLFASLEHVDHRVDCLEKNEEANPMILRQVLVSCTVSAKVFADLAAKMNLSNFLWRLSSKLSAWTTTLLAFRTRRITTRCAMVRWMPLLLLGLYSLRNSSSTSPFCMT